MTKFYIYVLMSTKDRERYVGFTTDVNRRLKEHNDGKCFSTKSRLPMKIIYYEVSGSEKDARAREKYIKSGMGKRYLHNRLKHQLTDL